MKEKDIDMIYLVLIIYYKKVKRERRHKIRRKQQGEFLKIKHKHSQINKTYVADRNQVVGKAFNDLDARAGLDTLLVISNDHSLGRLDEAKTVRILQRKGTRQFHSYVGFACSLTFLA